MLNNFEIWLMWKCWQSDWKRLTGVKSCISFAEFKEEFFESVR